MYQPPKQPTKKQIKESLIFLALFNGKKPGECHKSRHVIHIEAKTPYVDVDGKYIPGSGIEAWMWCEKCNVFTKPT